MKANVSKHERTVRIMLGFGICALGVYYHSWLGLFGLVPFVTGLVGWCPLYRLCGDRFCSTGPK